MSRSSKLSIPPTKVFGFGLAGDEQTDALLAAAGMTKVGVNATAILTSWGATPPAWIVSLAEACDGSSQAQVAKQLGISSAVVNQALKNTYAGRLDRVEERVRGELMKETVVCPVVGEITKRQCLDNQARGYAATNPLRVKLARACRTCPNRRES